MIRQRRDLNEAAPALYDSNLSYLQDEIEWVETRARRIALDVKIARGQDEYVTRPQWEVDQEDPLDVMQARRAELVDREESLRALIDASRALHVEQEGAMTLALDDICQMYGLSEFERRIMLLASAPVFSRRFDEIFSSLNMDGYGAACLNVEVIYNFAELPFAERIRRRTIFSKTAPLFANDLVSMDLTMRYSAPQDLLMASLHISTRTFGYLVGDDGLMDEFLEFSSVEIPRASFDKVVLDERDKQRILSVVERHDLYLESRREWGFDDVIQYGRGILMLFYGKPGTGKTMTAHAIANHMQKRVLNVDIPTFMEHHDAERFLPGLFREARLQNAILFFDECEVLFGDRRAGNVLMTMLLTEIERFEGVAILATNLPESLDPALERRLLVKVRFPEPDRQARLEIWRKHLPERAPLAEDVDLDSLADRYEMSGGYIKNAVLAAVASAVHEGDRKKQRSEIHQRHLEQAAQEQLRRPTNDDDSPLIVPQVRLQDVVLPEVIREHVCEITLAARSRRMVLERWKVGDHLTYGKGVSALFHGPPGTGKTLCAQAIAGELNRPLYAASIPSLVSKWVGETDKNLAGAFRTARSQSAVLFLDEADTLLMERGAGNASRHDDSAVNTLLTQIERFDGLVLLATNLPERLDSALERRLTYRVAFPMPTPALRARIWEGLLPETVPGRAGLDTDELGRRWELSGGLIKNAVFKAAFRAASDERDLTMDDLNLAAQEEIESSLGKRAAIGFGS